MTMVPSIKNTAWSDSMTQVSFIPTDEDRERVRLLAAIGVKQDIIARIIRNPLVTSEAYPAGEPICARTLRKYFRDELDLGMTEANAQVGQTLFQMATSGQCPAATIFWLKCRMGWRETTIVQNQTLDANGNAITPPTFGVSFANGGPGQASLETAPGLPGSATSEPEEVFDDAA
jgi:hypothetical protein